MRGPTGERARVERFEVDLTTGELFRSGVRIPLQDKPFQLLRLLLEAGGKPVSREQIRQALWPADTFVDFEHAVNTAMRKLRQALEDSAEVPRFVETLPKIGYRFVAPIQWIGERGEAVSQPAAVAVPAYIASIHPDLPPLSDAAAPGARWTFGPSRLALVGFALCVVAVLGTLALRPHARPSALRVLPFTTFPGFEIAPSFSPDGNSIAFSWFGYEKEFQFDLYVKQVGQERVLQLTHHPAMFLASAWSPDGRVDRVHAPGRAR